MKCQVLIHVRTQYILIHKYYTPDTYNSCNIYVVYEIYLYVLFLFLIGMHVTDWASLQFSFIHVIYVDT